MVRCAIVITSVITITHAAECVPKDFGFHSLRDRIGIAIDADENVFVADSGGTSLDYGQILKCSVADGCQTFTKAVGAQGVAVTPDGTVYYSEITGVKQCTPAGACVEFGSGWSPTGGTSGLEFDSTGNVYVTSEAGNATTVKGRISRCTPDGSCKLLEAAQDWCWPLHTAVDSRGNVYVTGLIDATESVYVKKCDSNGFCTEFTEFPGTWRGASAVAVDALDNVYIMAGQWPGVLRKCTPGGECREVALHGPKEFQGGNGIKIGANGAVYVSSTAYTKYDQIGSLIRYCIADSTEMV